MCGVACPTSSFSFALPIAAYPTILYIADVWRAILVSVDVFANADDRVLARDPDHIHKIANCHENMPEQPQLSVVSGLPRKI